MKQFIFVTDFFKEEINGGAELTLDAIIKAVPDNGTQISTIKTEFLAPSMLENPNIHWVFGNYTRIKQPTLEAWLNLCDKGLEYSIIEFDYKYCILRNELVHNYQLFQQNKGFGFCNCMSQPIGQIAQKLFYFATNLFFMSEEQKKLIYTRMPILKQKELSHFVQWSTWAPWDLQKLEDLYIQRQQNGHNQRWLIQESGNWLKGTEQTILEAQKKNYLYNVVPPMNYESFLREMSNHVGFMFHPNAWDTCPRVVVEAKLLGLEIDLNDKVQITQDPIFLQNRDELMQYLMVSPSLFWIALLENPPVSTI